MAIRIVTETGGGQMQTERTIPWVLSAQELSELVQKRPDVRLLDVRTPGEYESAHIVGAYNVPLDTLGEHADEIRATVNEPVVLICQSGARARRAEEVLKHCRMTNVHVLDGGMNGWLAAGQAVKRGAQRVSLERQVRIAAGALAGIGAILALLVHPLWALLPAFVGSGLVFAGVTDTCGMAMLLAKLPYNRVVTCDVEAMVTALKGGTAPSGSGLGGLGSPAAPRSCAS
jgi:rhodanese-related sulfurtransferase